MGAKKNIVPCSNLDDSLCYIFYIKSITYGIPS